MSSAPPATTFDHEPPGKALSMAALAVIVFLAFFIIGLIYLYIFYYAVMPDTSRYWWSGFVGFIFALIFYMVHASIREEPVTRILSGMFFILGAVFLYAAVALGTPDPGNKIMWLIVLSVVVLAVVVLVWRMSVQRAADDERRARRRRT